MQKKIFWSLLFLASSFSLTAQTVFHTLDDIWNYADQHNITLRTARYDYQKAQYAQKIALGSALPQINANGAATENTALQTTLIPGEIVQRPAGTFIPVQFGQKYIYSGGFTAQLDVLNLQNWLNVKIAKETTSAGKDSLANFKRNVYQQLASQYYNYLLMKEAAALAGQSMDISDMVNQSMTHKFAEGLVTKANADEAEINFERAKQSFTTSQYQMLIAANNLKLMLDMSPSDSIRIEEKLDKGEITLSDKEFAEDPGLRLTADQVNIGILQQKMASSNFFPVLSVLYSNTVQQNDNTFEPFNNSTTWYPARFWQLKASWQIFNGGGRCGQAKRPI